MAFLWTFVFVVNLGVVWSSVCNSGSVNWGQWEDCSVTCGGGARMRHCLYDKTYEVEPCSLICYHGTQFYGNHCQCIPGTTGECCEDILECDSNPCKNGGTCNEEINGYTCTCPPGTTSTHCDDIHECASNPCLNNGTCNERIGYYTCDCPYGTLPPICADIPECSSNPCQNGGVCEEFINHFICRCPPGTTGDFCDDIPECDSNPCTNGGTCTEGINGYTCSCPTGYVGADCEKYLLNVRESTCRAGSPQACYVAFDHRDTWEGAKAFCEARNGHLFVPNDITESLFVENYMDSMRGRFPEEVFWIGGQKADYGRFSWLPGQNTREIADRWADGTELVTSGTECLVIDSNYGFLWQSRDCNSERYYICEEEHIFTLPILG